MLEPGHIKVLDKGQECGDFNIWRFLFNSSISNVTRGRGVRTTPFSPNPNLSQPWLGLAIWLSLSKKSSRLLIFEFRFFCLSFSFFGGRSSGRWPSHTAAHRRPLPITTVRCRRLLPLLSAGRPMTAPHHHHHWPAPVGRRRSTGQRPAPVCWPWPTADRRPDGRPTRCRPAGVRPATGRRRPATGRLPLSALFRTRHGPECRHVTSSLK